MKVSRLLSVVVNEGYLQITYVGVLYCLLSAW